MGTPPGQSGGPAQQDTTSHLAHSTLSHSLVMIKTLNSYPAEGQPIQQGQHCGKRGAWEP